MKAVRDPGKADDRLHAASGRTIERELERQDYILLQTTGVSMEPLLHHHRSTVQIRKPFRPVEKYDVVLFRRRNGEYVLHRVLRVRQKDYLICGDHGTDPEAVSAEQILGIMTGFFPDESGYFLTCEDKKYRRYVRTFKLCYRLRRLKAVLGRACRKYIR